MRSIPLLTEPDKLAVCEMLLEHEEVRVLAHIAHRAGAHGLVCSPEEVEEMRC